MSNSGDLETDAVPLREALLRLSHLRDDIQAARHLGERGIPLPREQLSRRLEEVDHWLDELIAILGERTTGSIEP